MLFITAFVQPTFYNFVAYFERRRVETESRLKKYEMYTSYAINNISHWESKANRLSVALSHRSKQVFQVTPTLHRFHMDKGNNKKVVKLKE